MSAESPQFTPASPPNRPTPGPITALDDPRAIQILSTEHWSQLTARSLAYNEAFIRGGMFLTFLTTSFVGVALLAQAMGFGSEFLTVVAVVLAFDFVIGLTTFGRIAGANADDLRAMHGMARIRHGYVQAAPILRPYFTSPVFDDVASVVAGYGGPSTSMLGDVLYGLTTSLGMIGFIVSMVGGILVAVLALIFGVSGSASVWIGLGSAAAIFVVIVVATMSRIPRQQAELTVLFPAEDQREIPDDEGRA